MLRRLPLRRLSKREAAAVVVVDAHWQLKDVEVIGSVKTDRGQAFARPVDQGCSIST
jgi:hypothetical protein